VSRRDAEPAPPRLTCRRDLFSALGGLVVLDLVAAGCRREEPLRPGELAIALDALADGQRTVVVLAGNPVEVLRTGDSLRARSLRCTHWGCVVRWREAERVYACPCHDGRFDADGNVIAGPPPSGLRNVPVRISGRRAVIGP
jgi:Rieske Fe-S protein